MTLAKLFTFSSRRRGFFRFHFNIMGRRINLIICCFLLCLAQLQADPSARLHFYYNIAEGNYLVGDLGGAERGIEQVLRLDPGHAPSLALKAKVLLDRNEGNAALEAADLAIVAAPEVFEYQILRALILGNLKRSEEAMTQIDAILKGAEPASKDARTALQLKGLLNMADQNWDGAADAFKKNYEAQPETSTAGRRLATEAYLEKARTAASPNDSLVAIDQAIALYSDATGRENLDALERLKVTRAQMLAQFDRGAEAIRALQQIIGRNPENLEATVTLASLYADREEWSALEGLIEPIARNPLLLDVALYLQGRVALSRDRVGTARIKFEEALEFNAERPTSLKPALHFYRSICFEKLQRHEDAEASLRTALDRGYIPETAAEAVHLGKLLLRSGEAAEVIPTLERALLNNPDSAEGWAILGRAHLKEEQNALALSAFNQSLALEPQQSMTLALRGSLLRKIGDPEGALSDYERAHARIPSSPVLSYERGLTLLQLGRVDEAEPFLRLAARKLTTHVTLDLLHASVAYAVEDYAAAAQSLREYLNPNLEGEALQNFKSNLSDTSAYLYILLTERGGIELTKPLSFSQTGLLFKKYTRGEATRKDVLDWAGRADSPEKARVQICTASYWLAQYELLNNATDSAVELLQIALEAGSPESPEWQFANWLKPRL